MPKVTEKTTENIIKTEGHWSGISLSSFRVSPAVLGAPYY